MRKISLYFFLFTIFIFVFGCCGFMQRVSRSSSFVLPLLSGTGFSVYLFTSSAESCDEDDEEVGEGVVEEELVNKPGTTNGT